MRARGVIYAALFTAGVEALAIFATQEEPTSGRVLAAQIALAAPRLVVARAEVPVAAPFIVPARLRAASQPARVAQDTPNQANAAHAAMASATGKLNNKRPLYDSMLPQYRIVRKHQMVRQQRWPVVNYMWP
jgi:hypothetical protein